MYIKANNILAILPKSKSKPFNLIFTNKIQTQFVFQDGALWCWPP